MTINTIRWCCAVVHRPTKRGRKIINSPVFNNIPAKSEIDQMSREKKKTLIRGFPQRHEKVDILIK